MAKRVAVTGSSGLIGRALCQTLAGRGDEVVRLVRRPTQRPDEVEWDPIRGLLDPARLDGVDAVVNLAGEGIGERRWNAQHKRLVERSRVDATSTVVRSLVAVRDRTGHQVRLVNGSAVGFYGDRGDEVLTEASPCGTDFLAGVVERWEAATTPAVEAGLSVATARTGLVMSQGAGAFAPLLRLTRLGLGGPLGSGREFWPWITLVDAARALTHLVDRADLAGPVNVVAPQAARQREIAAALGRALSRPALLPAPRLALRAAVGEFADSILASQRVHPFRLLGSGFHFEHPELDGAVRWLTGR